jgi:hypothetical protein
VLDIDVAGAFGRAGGVDHVDGGLVVFMEDRRAGLGEAKFVEDGTKVLGDFGGIDSSDEFGFGGAGGDGRLYLGLVGNGSTGETEAEASDRAAGARASGMGSVDETGEFEGREASREARERGIGGESSMGAGCKCKAGLGTPVDERPVSGVTKVEGDTAEGLVVDLGRSSGETGKKGNSIANVEAADNVGVDEFTEETTVAKTILVLEGSMFGGVLSGADGVEVGYDGRGDRLEGLGTGLTFLELGGFPAVLEQEALNVGRARQCSIISGLVDVEAIVGGTDSKFLEVDMFSFVVLDGTDLVEYFVGNLGIGAGDAEIVDLAAEEDCVILVHHPVDVALMGG